MDDVVDGAVADEVAGCAVASAMVEWIEGFYNPTRRHTALGNLSPIEFETLHTAASAAV